MSYFTKAQYAIYAFTGMVGYDILKCIRWADGYSSEVMTLQRYLTEAPGSLLYILTHILLLACMYLYILRRFSAEMRTADWTAMQVDHIRKRMTEQEMEVPRPLYRTMPRGAGKMTWEIRVAWIIFGCTIIMGTVVLLWGVAEGVVNYPDAGMAGVWKSLWHHVVLFEPYYGASVLCYILEAVCAWKIIEPLKDAEIYAWQQSDELNRLTNLCHEAGIAIDE